MKVQDRLLKNLESVNPHFGWRKRMAPGNQSDASGRLIGPLAEGKHFFGGLDGRFEKHLDRDGTCGIQCPGNLPGMGGNLFEDFRPV